MLLLLIALACFYYYFYQASLNTSYEYMDVLLQEIGAQIDTTLNDVTSSMLKLAYSTDIYQKFINASPVLQFESSGVIQTMLNSLSDSNRAINSIVIRLKDGKAILTENVKNSGELYIVYNAIVKDYSLSSPFQEVIFTHCYTLSGSGNTYFACLVPIYNTLGGRRSDDRYEGAYIALCAVRNLVNPKQYSDSLTRPIIIIYENETVIYTDDDASASALAKSAVLNNGKGGTFRAENKTFQVRMGTVKTIKWDILCAVLDVELRSDLNRIRIWGLILTISVVLVQLLMGYFLKQSIVRPLSSIIKQIHKVGTGEGKTAMIVPDSSEIGIIAADIKDMLLRIERMNTSVMNTTRALYQAEKNRLMVQIMFLKAQINPHFLYNNLECIRGMAAAGDISGVRDIASTMASVYRYCISSGQLATLFQELEIARRFFTIISLRYPSRYELKIKVNKNLLNSHIPKMTLQPILENAFLHGLTSIQTGGIVEIEGWTEPGGEITLSVSDNGQGMDSIKMDEINRTLSDPAELFESGKVGIGILNVNSRIRLIFGEKYGIFLEPNTPRGLRVIIRFGKVIKLNDLVLSQQLPAFGINPSLTNDAATGDE
jgi:two-component system sensor histidine kinase YesM